MFYLEFQRLSNRIQPEYRTMTQPATTEPASPLRAVRLWTILFMIGLVISGLTAIPISSTFQVAKEVLGTNFSGHGAVPGFVAEWLRHVAQGVAVVNREAPYFYYGTDWLAFGHVAIALVFIGALRDPVRNRWLYTYGMITCALIVPWALMFGSLRGIPPWWRAIDCSFGILGFPPLWYCHHRISKWEKQIQ
ncbi:MAG TPA: hypothetical protein VMF06_23275 [Candidatus Limnocylindria bacterium]|nr:hypothetical protein [Candidatus Limnocylindria bacterium]